MNVRLELDLELAKKKAHIYAGKHGAVSPEAAYVHRFNGYFQGYVERSGEIATEVEAAKGEVWKEVVGIIDSTLPEKTPSEPYSVMVAQAMVEEDGDLL